MKTLKGPGLFLAQFIGDEAPFNRLETIAPWAANLGYAGLQLPTSTPHSRTNTPHPVSPLLTSHE